MKKGLVIGIVIGLLIGLLLGYFVFTNISLNNSQLSSESKVKNFVVNYAKNYQQDPQYLSACKNLNGLVVSKEGDNWKIICKWVNDPQFGNKDSIQLIIDQQGNILSMNGFGSTNSCKTEGQSCGGAPASPNSVGSNNCCSGLTCKLYPDSDIGTCEKSASCADYRQLCGGIAGISCCSGLTCNYNSVGPDASGACVALTTN